MIFLYLRSTECFQNTASVTGAEHGGTWEAEAGGSL